MSEGRKGGMPTFLDVNKRLSRCDIMINHYTSEVPYV